MPNAPLPYQNRLFVTTSAHTKFSKWPSILQLAVIKDRKQKDEVLLMKVRFITCRKKKAR